MPVSTRADLTAEEDHCDVTPQKTAHAREGARLSRSGLVRKTKVEPNVRRPILRGSISFAKVGRALYGEQTGTGTPRALWHKEW